LARFLALDWDHHELHVVVANVGRGGVRVQRAAVWQEEQSPNPATAEELGRLLRQRLKDAGIAPAPVLVSLGRDRVIVKEVRYPAVPDTDEPAVVRFQAVRELTDVPEEVVIDYTHLGGTAAPGSEQRALALIARKELLTTYQTLCKAAGLKLAALAPRPFGTVACLQHVAGKVPVTPPPEPPDATVAVLTVGEHWAEFCISRGEQLVLARSLATGRTLAGEVRRNLTVHAGQSPQQPVRALYVAADADPGILCQRLHELAEIPVYPLDPFGGVERGELPAPPRGTFVGAVGLLYTWAQHRSLPINFVQPKQPRPPRDPRKKRFLLAAAAAAAILVAAGVYCYGQLATKDRQLDELYVKKKLLDAQLVSIEEDAKRIKALEEWNQNSINWLDELYDLTERFPDPNGIRLINLTAEPSVGSAKDKHVAKVSLKGITTFDNTAMNTLNSHLEVEKHYRFGAMTRSRNTGIDRFRFGQGFGMTLQLEHRPPSQYVRQMEEPPPEERGRNRRGGGADMMFGFGGGDQ
jgi:hypothetical protein